MKIKLTEKVENDIIANYKGIYLDENKITLTEKSEVVDRRGQYQIVKDSSVYIDTAPVERHTKMIIGEIYEVDGIPTLYANNPLAGGVITVTKVKYLLTPVCASL